MHSRNLSLLLGVLFLSIFLSACNKPADSEAHPLALPEVQGIEDSDFKDLQTSLSNYSIAVPDEDIVKVEAVYVDGRMFAAMVPLDEARKIGYVSRPDSAAQIILAENTDHPEVFDFKNLVTGDSMTLSQNDFASEDREKRIQMSTFFNGGIEVTCGTVQQSLVDANTEELGSELTVQTVDDECLRDCLLGSVQVCVADCGLALVWGPVGYAACVSGCQGTWYTSCSIACNR